jgi:hypothetical protein
MKKMAKGKDGKMKPYGAGGGKKMSFGYGKK